MKFERPQIIAFLAASVLIWSAMLWVQDNPWRVQQYYPFFFVVGCMSGIIFVFDRWIWRWKYLHPWLVNIPDIRGTWKLNLESDYVDGETGKRIETRVVFFCVTQSLSSLQVYMYSRESDSTLLAEDIRPSHKGTGYQIVGVYSNRPRSVDRGKFSDMHLGAFVLETHGLEQSPDQITGHYWTNRKTTGFLTSTARVRRTCTTYDAAIKLFE